MVDGPMAVVVGYAEAKPATGYLRLLATMAAAGPVQQPLSLNIVSAQIFVWVSSTERYVAA